MLPGKVIPVVCIVESPSAEDVLDGRNEGAALSQALRLADIPNSYHAVVTPSLFSSALERAWSFVGAHIEDQQERLPSVPLAPYRHLHLSAHASERGIAFSDGSILGWTDLRSELVDFGQSAGLFLHDRNHFTLALSCCMGSSARLMLTGQPPWPCSIMIAANTDVAWADALTAFVVFYHQIIYRDQKGRDAVRLMNIAAGLQDSFATILAGDS